MKQLFTLLFTTTFTTFIMAQEAPEVPAPAPSKMDTSEMIMNGKRIIIITDEETKSQQSAQVVSISGSQRNRIWQGFEIGFTGVSYSENFSTDIPAGMEFFDPIVGTSINWAINPFELDVRLVGEYVKFSTGLGYIAKNFSLANNYLLQKDPVSGELLGAQDPNRTLERNRFRTGYITVPLMLFFNTDENPIRAFTVGIGVVGGVKIFEAYRLKYHADGQKTRENRNSGFNAEQFSADIRANIGFGGVNFYASYSMIPLFKENLGPQVYPYTIGISFVNSY